MRGPSPTGSSFTRSKKRGDYNKALQTLVFHGATPEILYEAHPHIGTDKLPRIMQRIRQTILDAGGGFVFNSRVTDLEIKGGRVRGVWCGATLVEGAAVVLATGHSAVIFTNCCTGKACALKPRLSPWVCVSNIRRR